MAVWLRRVLPFAIFAPMEMERTSRLCGFAHLPYLGSLKPLAFPTSCHFARPAGSHRAFTAELPQIVVVTLFSAEHPSLLGAPPRRFELILTTNATIGQDTGFLIRGDVDG
jgi:hypothetical protein